MGKAEGPIFTSLVHMANDYDDYTESMLNGSMCTERCPCYFSPNSETDPNSGYQKYKKLPAKYLKLYGRSF